MSGYLKFSIPVEFVIGPGPLSERDLKLIFTVLYRQWLLQLAAVTPQLLPTLGTGDIPDDQIRCSPYIPSGLVVPGRAN